MAKKKTNINAVKLTLQDVINKKLQKDSNEVKYIDIYASKLGGNLTFKIPTDDETFEIIDELGEDKSTKHIRDVYAKMIYRRCDMLHEKEVLEAYEITVGFDLVAILFSNKDIMTIGNAIVDATGFGEKEEEIKN
jgi:hypothetical protein